MQLQAPPGTRGILHENDMNNLSVFSQSSSHNDQITQKHQLLHRQPQQLFPSLQCMFQSVWSVRGWAGGAADTQQLYSPRRWGLRWPDLHRLRSPELCSPLPASCRRLWLYKEPVETWLANDWSSSATMKHFNGRVKVCVCVGLTSFMFPAFCASMLSAIRSVTRFLRSWTLFSGLKEKTCWIRVCVPVIRSQLSQRQIQEVKEWRRPVHLGRYRAKVNKTNNPKRTHFKERLLTNPRSLAPGPAWGLLTGPGGQRWTLKTQIVMYETSPM